MQGLKACKGHDSEASESCVLDRSLRKLIIRELGLRELSLRELSLRELSLRELILRAEYENVDS